MSARRKTAGWSSPTAVTDAIVDAYRRGSLLRDLSAPDGPWERFPLRVRLVGPAPAELSERFAQASAWAQSLADDARRRGWQLEWRPVRVGGLGVQQLPVAATVATPTSALGLLGRAEAAEAARFAEALATISVLGPAAQQVALSRPHDVLGAGDDWPLLVDVVRWVAAHPRPGIWLRQVPVTGIHTKIVERHATLLGRLLLAVLPDDAVDTDARTFATRFGFREEPRRVRLRAEAALLGAPGGGESDVEWPLTALAALEPEAAGLHEILVLENKVSFLTVPVVTGRLVLWGAGYGAADLIGAIGWRDRVAVRYWGDIDTHGFAILSQLRSVASHATSVLMDRATLLANRSFWVREPAQHRNALSCLTDVEADLYRSLLGDELGTAVRLEQEFVRFDLVAAALSD